MEENGKNELYQEHGDHICCIMDSVKFVSQHLQQVIHDSFVLEKTKTRVSTDTMDNELTDVSTLWYGRTDIAMMTLIAYNPKESTNELASMYPVTRGRTYRVKIERVMEWCNHIEATIICSIGEFSLAFFAIDYSFNKARYVEEQELDVDLSAMGMKVEPGQTGFDLMGQEAINFRAKTGEEPEYDENGEVLPIHFDLSKLVAYLNTDDKAPDEAEFQSPVKNISDDAIFGVDFHKVDITVHHGEDDAEDISVPLYFRKDFLETVKEGDSICGYLWMTGAIRC